MDKTTIEEQLAPTNILEIAAESRSPAKWAAMQIVKAGRPNMTIGDAMDMIEAIVERAMHQMHLNAAPLHGEWRHSEGVICCGTLRIANAAFDTDPSPEFQKEVLDWMCERLNERPPEPTTN